jgi:branched-chain amino acid aminotransferase
MIMEAVMSKKINIQRVGQSRLSTVDFDHIPFGKIFADHMLVADYADGKWGEPKIVPYGDISFAPAMSALHYGQSIFEGLKAYKNQRGEAVLFRPRENWERMNHSAVRMCMPEIPEEIFMDGLQQLVQLDQAWIPSNEGCSLYVRPFMFATDEFVGIRPSESYRFIIFSCPVGAYYSEPVGLMVTAKYVRAIDGGTGEAKAAGNYGASLLGAKEAKDAGYHNVLWLDGRQRKYVEECGTMNIFFVIDGVAVTPRLDGTILHGTTRQALIELLGDMGVEVQERRISVEELFRAHADGSLQEAFGAGTAATVAPVGRIGHDGSVPEIEGFGEIVFKPVSEFKVANELLKRLSDIRVGLAADIHGWVMPV